jgi:hypothetical protein
MTTHDQREQRLFVELCDRLASLVGRQARIAERHADEAADQQMSHRVERNTLLDEPRRAVMPQIVPTEVSDPGSLEDIS